MTKLERKKASIDKKLDKIYERINRAEFDLDRVYGEKFYYLTELLGELNGKHTSITAYCSKGVFDIYLSVGDRLWNNFSLNIDEVNYMIDDGKDLLWFLDFSGDNNPMGRRLKPQEFDRYHYKSLYAYGRELKRFREAVKREETKEERERMQVREQKERNTIYR